MFMNVNVMNINPIGPSLLVGCPTLQLVVGSMGHDGFYIAKDAKPNSRKANKSSKDRKSCKD
jgi:hypothetical protein